MNGSDDGGVIQINVDKHENFDYQGVQMSEKNKGLNSSTEAENVKKTTMFSGINLDAKFENENPEIKADEDFDEEVRFCQTPLKYIK